MEKEGKGEEGKEAKVDEPFTSLCSPPAMTTPLAASLGSLMKIE